MRIAAILVGLICFATAPALATDSPDTYPAEPPAGATLPQPDAQRVARNGNGEEIQVRAIDDPANPYAGKYSDFDRWLYEHYTPQVTETLNIKSREEWQALLDRYPKDWQFLNARVDASGWPIPLVENHGMAIDLRSAKTINEYLDKSAQLSRSMNHDDVNDLWRKAFYFNAVGHMPQELADELQVACRARRARRGNGARRSACGRPSPRRSPARSCSGPG